MDQVGTDESGCPGDETFHVAIVSSNEDALKNLSF
jgi:hypothetical protein